MHAFRILASTTLALAAGLLFALPGVAQGTREQQDEFERLWGECDKIWFQGKEHLTRQERLELFNSFTSERELTPKQKDCILRMADLLVDKQWPRGFRQGAAQWLGDMGHAYCVPPLLAVVRDDNEHEEMRARCVYALSHIRDDRAVDAVIDTLAEEERWVAQGAHQALHQMFWAYGMEKVERRHPAVDAPRALPDNLEWRRQYRDKWRRWWEENQGRVEIDRDATYGMG